MRLGFAAPIDPEVEVAIRGLVMRLGDAGCEVREIEPELADPLSIYETITQANYGSLLRHLNEEQVAQLSPVLRAARAAGLALKASDLLAAQADRCAFAQSLEVALGPYDILITPTVSVPAFEAESYGPPRTRTDQGSGSTVWYPFCYPFNLSSQPALSLPCASTREGLPIGCQLVARAWQESLLLQVGEQIESLLIGSRPRSHEHGLTEKSA
jgi:aspartyl-tRNA(Asn)/glutamyl-tRNA(Gln) amidotransferase subunit A